MSPSIEDLPPATSDTYWSFTGERCSSELSELNRGDPASCPTPYSWPNNLSAGTIRNPS